MDVVELRRLFDDMAARYGWSSKMLSHITSTITETVPLSAHKSMPGFEASSSSLSELSPDDIIPELPTSSDGLSSPTGVLSNNEMIADDGQEAQWSPATPALQPSSAVKKFRTHDVDAHSAADSTVIDLTSPPCSITGDTVSMYGMPTATAASPCESPSLPTEAPIYPMQSLTLSSPAVAYDALNATSYTCTSATSDKTVMRASPAATPVAHGGAGRLSSSTACTERTVPRARGAGVVPYDDDDDDDLPIMASIRKPTNTHKTAYMGGISAPSSPVIRKAPLSNDNSDSDSDCDVPLSKLRRGGERSGEGRGKVSTSARANLANLAGKKTQRKSIGLHSRFIDDEASCSSEGEDEEEGEEGGGTEVDPHGYELNDGFVVADDVSEGEEATSEDGEQEGSVHDQDEGDDEIEEEDEEEEEDEDVVIAPRTARKQQQDGLKDGDVDPSTGLVVIAEERGGAPTKFKNKAHRDTLTNALFKEYNKRVFHNKLASDMKVEWGPRLTKTAGLTYMSRKIEDGQVAHISRLVLSTKVLDTPYKLAQTLLHELCHAAAWSIDHVSKPPHGSHFKKWALKATSLYPDREVTVCHSYDIQYKYKYACTSCGVTIGRHSKSLDVSRTMCNFRGCGGSFVLTSGEDGSSVPATPKPLTEYQKFVKDARASVVKQFPSLTPQLVMKEVGRQWSAMKSTGKKPAEAINLLVASDAEEDDDENVTTVAAPVKGGKDKSITSLSTLFEGLEVSLE